MAAAYSEPTTRIGLILGTGTNACYMEKLDRVGTWDGDYNEPREVIINMEWGAFGDNGRLNDFRTRFDEEVDLSSVNHGKQRFVQLNSIQLFFSSTFIEKRQSRKSYYSDKY